MLARFAGILCLLLMLTADPARAVTTLGLQGPVAEVGAAASGISIGAALTGTISYNEAAQFCPFACPITDLTLDLPGDVSLGLGDLDGVGTVNVVEFPGSLDAALNIPGKPFGIDNGILFSGLIASGGFGTFEIFGDPAGSTFIASGTLTVTSLPAGLWSMLVDGVRPRHGPRLPERARRRGSERPG